SLEILDEILDVNKNTFKSLLANYKDTTINNLNDDLLPRSVKKNDLKSAILQKRNTMRYRIDEPNNEFDNDGLDPNKYQKILKDTEINNNKIRRKIKQDILNNRITGAKVLEEEKKLDKSLAGTYLLPYVFDLINFDPEKLKNNDGSHNHNYFAKVIDIPKG